jgi:hypothetical protein
VTQQAGKQRACSMIAARTGLGSRVPLTWAGEFVAGLSLAPFDRGEHIKQRPATVP